MNINTQSPRRKRSAEPVSPRLTLDGYLPLADVADELLRRDGHPHAHWTRFFEALEALAPGELEGGFAAADRHIRDMGVSYRAYGEKNDRSSFLRTSGVRSKPVFASALNCSNIFWRTSIATDNWCATARFRPRQSPAAPIICVRSSA
jgi:hypothetical protein